MYHFWELFDNAPLAMQAFGLLQLAFTVWMAVDAYHRQAEFFWYWVIFFFQPLGAWVYFFAVKFRTFRWPGGRAVYARERRLSLDELRYRVERGPTVANRLALSECLMEKARHADAIPYLEAVLIVEPDYCPALHALAQCRLATKAAEQAVAPLEKLLQRDARWNNYQAWRTMIEVHLGRSQPGEALKACRELEKRQPSLENKCLLAGHLLENDLAAEAARMLEQALEDHHYATWAVRWRDWSWARAARRLLAEAEKGAR